MNIEDYNNESIIPPMYEGYDDEGFSWLGNDSEGFDRDGFSWLGYNREGYNRRGYDREGYDRSGFNKEGFDCEGWDKALIVLAVERHPPADLKISP